METVAQHPGLGVLPIRQLSRVSAPPPPPSCGANNANRFSSMMVVRFTSDSEEVGLKCFNLSSK